MTVHDSHERNRARTDDWKPTVVEEAGRDVVVERLRSVTEPSSAVDHLLSHLSGGRSAAEMTLVDWALPVVRTGGRVALRVVDPARGEAAYLGFDGGRYVATPWEAPSSDRETADRRPVAPRDWWPADAGVNVLPVELSPLTD